MPNSPVDIPTEPLPTSSMSSSLFPDVALHRRAGKFVHESSYSMPIFAAIMCGMAIGVCFIPWDERILLGRGPRVVEVIAGGIVWGAICVLGVFWLRNRFGQTITIEPDDNRLTIPSPDRHLVLNLDDVVGIQLCRCRLGHDPKSRSQQGFQMNLVYRTKGDNVDRHCVYSHVRKGPCLRLANQYQAACDFEVFDHTHLPNDAE